MWVAPKAIPDKANHPNFPQFQSIEYAERAHQPWACCKIQEIQRNAAEKTANAEEKTEEAENRQGWLCRGWLWVTWTMLISDAYITISIQTLHPKEFERCCMACMSWQCPFQKIPSAIKPDQHLEPEVCAWWQILKESSLCIQGSRRKLIIAEEGWEKLYGSPIQNKDSFTILDFWDLCWSV